LRSLVRDLDFKFVLLSFLIFFCLSCGPYLYGYISAPPGKKFVGLVGWDVAGSYMYFMWERQTAEGDFLLENRLTPEKHAPFYFNLEWLLLGRMIKYTGLSMIAGFHLERFLTMLAAFAILYYLLTCFFDHRRERRLVFLWIISTSGLGWIFWLLQDLGGLSWSIRVWDIEGVNLFGYLINKPHVIRSLAMICLSYALLLKGEQTQRRVYFILAGLSILVQGFIRPYDLPTAFLLLVLFPTLICIREGRFSKARFLNYFLAALTAAPIYFYYILLHLLSVLKDSFRAVDFPAFTPLELVTWLGIPLLLMVASFDGLRRWRNWSVSELFLYLWYAIVLGLIYAYPIIPWGMESAGLCYIAAPIVAGIFLFRDVIPRVVATTPWQGISSRFHVTGSGLAALAFVPVIVLSLPSNVVLTARLFHTLANHSRPYYIPTDVADAFQWLEHHAQPRDLVLSHPGNGYHLPADAGVRAFVGHGHFTINYQQKVEQMLYFYNAAASEPFRKELLKKYGIDYVFFGDLERATGAFDPLTAPYLSQVYANATAAIYKVVADRL
jgi:hypothetical protein